MGKKDKERFLVTGGAGMIGSSLIKRLASIGHEVIVVDDLSRGSLDNLIDEEGQVVNFETNFFKKDLTQPGVLDKHLKDIDYVFHLADVVGSIDYVFDNQLFVFHQNIIMNTNVIDSVRKSNIKGYVYTGTSCSFPKELQTGKQKLQEGQQYPANPESSYGWSKLMGEYEASLLEKTTDIRVATFVFHNVYGPSIFDTKTAQVIPSLIKKAIDCPNGGKLEVWGNGKQGRDFIHVNDAINALLEFKKGFGQASIQIGSGKFTTIKELAEIIRKISKKHFNIQFDKTKLIGDLGRYASIEKAKKLLCWHPEIPLEDGISSLYNFMVATYKTDRSENRIN
jgi:GDP-D-mannose 3', 5'-epimerase